MHVRLLHSVVGAHALVNRDDVCLLVWEVIGLTREVRDATVDREDVPRYIVARAHLFEDRRVALGDSSELRMAVGARRCDLGNGDVVDHPPFIPAALVVDDQQWRDVGENIDVDRSEAPVWAPTPENTFDMAQEANVVEKPHCGHLLQG